MFRVAASALVLALALMPAARGARRHFEATIPSDAEAMPVPPVPPDHPPSDRDAPLPNGLLQPGVVPRGDGPSFSPTLINPRDYNIGQGYTPGSTIQGEQRRRAPPTPGFNLSVPLR